MWPKPENYYEGNKDIITSKNNFPLKTVCSTNTFMNENSNFYLKEIIKVYF